MFCPTTGVESLTVFVTVKPALRMVMVALSLLSVGSGSVCVNAVMRLLATAVCASVAGLTVTVIFSEILPPMPTLPAAHVPVTLS